MPEMVAPVARAMAALRNNAEGDGAIMDLYGDLARAAIAAIEQEVTNRARLESVSEETAMSFHLVANWLHNCAEASNGR